MNVERVMKFRDKLTIRLRSLEMGSSVQKLGVVSKHLVSLLLLVLKRVVTSLIVSQTNLNLLYYSVFGNVICGANTSNCYRVDQV